jgi:RNA polymerase sigma-70 factor (ECF subfamily)
MLGTMRRPWESSNDLHARLARRAAGGDQAAFVALYRALYPPVARFVGRRVRTPADAEDAVAQTFHRLLEALPRLDAARGSILGYALATARHAVADQGRLRRNTAGAGGAGEAEVVDAGPDPLALLEAGRSHRALAEALSALPPEARRLLELRYGDGLRHAEIAALTGANEAAVKQRLSRLLRGLRGVLAGGGDRTEEVAP